MTLTRKEIEQMRWDDRRREKALAKAGKLAARRERVLGPDHPDTLIAMVRLQELLYLKLRNHGGLSLEAEDQLAADCARVLGPNHPDTLSSWALMKSFRWPASGGLSLEAEEQLAADCARVLGPNHPATRILRNSRADKLNELTPPGHWDPSWQ
jgi:hypothetical protein